MYGMRSIQITFEMSELITHLGKLSSNDDRRFAGHRSPVKFEPPPSPPVSPGCPGTLPEPLTQPRALAAPVGPISFAEEQHHQAMGCSSAGRGSLQLWQFLAALLRNPGNAPCIAWTGRGLEFKLTDPEEVGMAGWAYWFSIS